LAPRGFIFVDFQIARNCQGTFDESVTISFLFLIVTFSGSPN